MLHKKGANFQSRTGAAARLNSDRPLSTLPASRQAGFSLIELLVVVGIIGILASVAVPAYNKYREDAIIKAAKAQVINIKKAISACLAIGTKFTTCGANTVDGVVTGCATAGSTAPSNFLDSEKCYIGSTTTTNSKICVSSYKVTGAMWSYYCSSYDASTGIWTDSAAGSGEADTPNTKYCKNDGTCA